MTDPADIIKDLRDNYDINFWGDLLEKYEHRLTELHQKIDSTKYTEWGLVALKAIQGDDRAKSVVSKILAANSDEKKIIDEMALIYLIQPLIRHFFFRASNHAQEQKGPAKN